MSSSYTFFKPLDLSRSNGSSYTFFKSLNLSRSNGKKKKKTLINVNILIRISLIILHLLYFISISKPKKKCYI